LEFYKVKKLLERSPNVLKEDPVLAVDYLKIIQLIRRKKLLEFSGNHFDAANQYYTKWLDKSIIERKEKVEEYEESKKFEQSNWVEGAILDDEDNDDDIKKSTKMQVSEKYKIVQQFDKLATAFEKKGNVE